MAFAIDKSLLSAELQGEEEEEEFRRLLLQATQKIQSAALPPADYKPIQPLPGFCLKTRTDAGEKVFVNVCRSPHIPPPPDLTSEELECLIESDNASTFRIPMSLGEPHAEVDKSGHGCTAYDVTINTDFFAKMESNHFLREFFITIALEGLAEKYKLDISHAEWCVLKNRKFLGSISEQRIRTKSQPIIQEMDSSPTQETTSKLLQSVPTQSAATVPTFAIVAQPPSHPDRLVATISLPKMNSVKMLELDLGEDRIVLRDHPGWYHLDIFIPYSIVPEESKAQFNKRTKTWIKGVQSLLTQAFVLWGTADLQKVRKVLNGLYHQSDPPGAGTTRVGMPAPQPRCLPILLLARRGQ
ncbi:PIH1 domain-containing protein 1 [Sphaerodactylus townsendi]|uniref:PIH1 domain-containing protein 1 n=1 Tax=Sphaerodactylus townsendi TaxID=933632 RepID=UPI002025CB29|nr:PIH1 domain-containing protein 1 [Sphaerodactylus townsendi]